MLRIRDVYPGSWILIFTHPGSRIQNQEQKRGAKKKFVVIFFVATNFTKLQIISIFYVEEKNLANFKKIIELFTQKIVTKLAKIWVRDPGSGKNLFRIPDPGVKKAPDPGSRIRIRNTACNDGFYLIYDSNNQICLYSRWLVPKHQASKRSCFSLGQHSQNSTRKKNEFFFS